MKRSFWLAVLMCLGAATQVHAQGLPYPSTTIEQIKGIGAEGRDQWFWPQMTGNHAGGVITNIPWSFFQPANTTPPCPPGQDTYQNSCYNILPDLDTLVQSFTNNGVLVTGILVLPPDWAAWPGCPIPGVPVFCGVNPIYASMFGRFAGYIAHRYNGLNGHGRIVNFVIHNEVNAPTAYFKDNCSTCTVAQEVARYSDSYIRAYDQIKAEQGAAKVLASMMSYFDGPDATAPGVQGFISIKTYISQLAALVGPRELKIALHAYGRLLDPTFGPDDSPLASIGMLGRVTGWLRQAFPSRPSIWEVHLTEQGLHGDLTPAGEAQQADWLCKAYQNVLGTPGVESYMYTPATTHDGFGNEHQELVYCALDPAKNCDTSTVRFRPAWATWALANRTDIGRASCGFELVPYVKLSRYYSTARGHFSTTRLPPAGSNFEGSWRLWRNPQPGTHLLSECLAASGVNYSGPHTLIDTGTCGGLTPMGPLGYAYDSPAPGLVALHRCYVSAAGFEDHFIQTDNCGGWSDEGVVGYVLPN
ncbi:MAG TPA: DUF5722 domain-containing protein [Kofleriaceae bacterium]|jgi:hypothetical protein|nr:DUF5722 domain-containing protein [Kofleriaceae bacterium]